MVEERKPYLMTRIPVFFTHQGVEYKGVLMKVQGAGGTAMFHLLIDNYYKGCLRFTDKWVFDSDTMGGIAERLGEFVVAWEDSRE